MEQDIILVNTNDHPIGSSEKLAAHKKPLLHRAFSVFLYNGDKMLIQQRAADKYHSGGAWSNGCCSHPRVGEQLADAVQTRMVEELGFCCPVQEIFSFIYYAKFAEDLYEYEYDHVFVGKYSGKIELNPSEASDYAWISLTDLERELVADPKKYSVWFLHCAQRVIDYVRSQN